MLESKEEMTEAKKVDPSWKWTTAGEIEEGGCFVKKTGKFAYLRIGKSSIKYLKLDQGKVYGVCYNGNIAVVETNTEVWSVPFKQMFVNRGEEIDSEERSPEVE